MNSRAGLRGTQPASIVDLGPGPTRTLVASLSSPELRHILKRWQIRHPSGIPLCQVERSDLIELAAKFEVSRALCSARARPLSARETSDCEEAKRARDLEICGEVSRAVHSGWCCRPTTAVEGHSPANVPLQALSDRATTRLPGAPLRHRAGAKSPTAAD